jgi:ribosomal-protein-alanine N-acetyltransferase
VSSQRSAASLVGTSDRELTELSRIHASSFSKAWSTDALRELLEMPGAFALDLKQEGQAVGFVLLRMALDEAEIITLAIMPSARRQDLARSLLGAAGQLALDRGAQSLVLEVDRTNEPALRLYRATGFREIGTRPAYYGTGRDGSGDALVMRAALPLPALGNRTKTD